MKRSGEGRREGKQKEVDVKLAEQKRKPSLG
jgi:hypothetical protein